MLVVHALVALLGSLLSISGRYAAPPPDAAYVLHGRLYHDKLEAACTVRAGDVTIRDSCRAALHAVQSFAEALAASGY